jgi:hypothetical protein
MRGEGGTTAEIVEAGMAENGLSWRRDAETALDEAKQNGRPALVDFTAAPM